MKPTISFNYQQVLVRATAYGVYMYILSTIQFLHFILFLNYGRSKLEVDDSKLMLQQWEASLQQQRYELLMQQQQNERAIQQHWDQLKREYAMPQQPGYNVPAYGQRSSGYLPVHPPGPDMYPESRGL